MDVESLAKQLILQNMTPEQQNAVLESVRASLLEARNNQKRRVSENVGMVVDALKKIEADIRAKYDDLGNQITTRVNSIKDGRDGIDGRDGKDGKDGRPGRDGAAGPMGPAGRDGRDGVDGEDGVSVIDAKIDFDGSLIISLSNGREINVGEVVAPDLAERIKVITNGGGTSQSVLDTLASLQAQIDALTVLTYKGTWNASTNTPTLASGVGDPGDYYIVSVAGTTNLDGITDWQPGDWAIFNGTEWQKIDQSWATAGANNNITSMTGITGGISSPDFVQFDTTATVTNAAGRLYWDDTQKTLTVGLNANISADIGQTLYAYATNDESVTINKGQPVYMFSAQGDRVSVKLAYNTGDATSAKTLGICAENIAAGQAGLILCQGVQDGLDMSAYSPGDTLYLGATAGTLTNVKPYAPNHLVYIGVVERANAGNGRLYVRVQNGYEMDELHNVSAQNPSNGQVLIYNASTSLWEKNTLTDGTAISITEGPGSITITNTGVTGATAGTGISVSGSTGSVTFTNTGVTSLTGTANEVDVSASTGSVTISLPATINANTTGQAGSVANALTAGTGISYSTGSTYNGSTAITINNSAPDQVVSLTGGTGISTSGTYPNFTITNSSPDQVVALTAGTGISTSGTYPNFTITNSAPDQTVSLTGAGTTNITGTYPNFTITSNDQYAGTVTSVGGTGTVNGISLTGTVTSSGSLTLGGTLTGVDLTSQVTGTLPIANGGTGQTTRQAAMDALAGAVTSGFYLRGDGTDVVMSAIQAADVPTLNQNTTGSAATLTTARTIQTDLASTSSASFNGSADITPGVTGTLAVANGGTGQTSYTDGQLLIGNSTGNTLAKATLTAGSGISITNGAGSITIAASGGGGSGTVTSVSAGAGMSFTTITTSGSVAMGTPSTITNTSTNTASGTSHNHALTGELVETTAGSPLYYGARAWVKFNGTGTVAINGSVNVSSITDNGVGAYTVNFSTAMPDDTYALSGQACFPSAHQGLLGQNSTLQYDANGVRIGAVNSAAGTLYDSPRVSVVIHR
jgi:hypothetical protein